jgi:hypothetical protein
MSEDIGRVAAQPGSRPSDQAPAGLDASRVDPSRDAEWWLRRIKDEPDCPISAGVPTDMDRLWNIQMLAAIGIEETNDEGPLADLFANIHRIAASGMSAGTAKTPQAAEGEARQPDPEGETPKSPSNSETPHVL